MSCVECRGESKYKCPMCQQPYCSVACCKKHKKTPCSPPSPPPSSPPRDNPEENDSYEFPTDDTVPPERLKALDQSKDIKKCLENPHVRKILEILDKAPHPDELMQEYMQEPIFTEFVDACLKVVQPEDDNEVT